MSNAATTPARASHQRRPDTYRATGRDGSVYLLDATRPVTHAVIATNPGSPAYSVHAYEGTEAAERAAARRRADCWHSVEVVELEVPATTGGRPSMSAAAFHLARAEQEAYAEHITRGRASLAAFEATLRAKTTTTETR